MEQRTEGETSRWARQRERNQEQCLKGFGVTRKGEKCKGKSHKGSGRGSLWHGEGRKGRFMGHVIGGKSF